MKTRLGLVLCWTLLATTELQSAERPANDDFTNRIALVGSSVTFTGTLVGATREFRAADIATEINACYGVPCSGSVWWSWTAPETRSVILEALDHFKSNTSPCYNPEYACLTVRPSTTLEPDFPAFAIPGSDSNSPVACMVIVAGVSRPYQIFSATAGSTYYLQVTGCAEFFRFRLLATNVPVITEQPVSQTVSSSASVLFTVAAIGVPPLRYQWQRNGIVLPSETNGVLIIHNVTSEFAGTYSVRISNNAGTTESEAAQLWVSASDLPPSLVAVNLHLPQTFAFSLLGETGRTYRIESSSNLTYWALETSFSGRTLMNSPLTSVIFNDNSGRAIQVPGTNAHKFIRASRYVPPNEICNANLKAIRFAKEHWVRQTSAVGVVDWSLCDFPATPYLAPFLGNDWTTRLRCPLTNYQYVLTQVGSETVCWIPAHRLEEPR